MAQFPQLPLFTDAILGDTQHLTTLEFGAYMLTLIIAWRTDGCCLPDDDIYLSRITRTGRGWSRVKDAVMAFWVLGEDGKHRQKRLTSEHLRAAEYVAQKSEAGKSSALKRKESRATGVAAALTGRTNGSSTPTLTPIPTPTKSKSSAGYSPEFEKFWKAYPGRGGEPNPKKPAWLSFQKALRAGVEAQTIIGAAERLAIAAPRRPSYDARFNQMAVTWLNQEAWADVIEKRTAAPGTAIAYLHQSSPWNG